MNVNFCLKMLPTQQLFKSIKAFEQQAFQPIYHSVRSRVKNLSMPYSSIFNNFFNQWMCIFTKKRDQHNNFSNRSKLLSSRHYSQYSTVFKVGSKIVNFFTFHWLIFFINTNLVMKESFSMVWSVDFFFVIIYLRFLQ